MAKILFGPVVGYARNKQGAVVFTRNLGGDVTRARVTPANPNTTFQQAIRASHAALLNRWSSTLTDSQRQAWVTRAQQITRTDRLGQQHTRKGQQFYVLLNQQALSAGGSYIDDPPPDLTTTEPEPITNATASAATQEILLTTATTPKANEVIQVKATRPLGGGRHNFTAEWRIVKNT